jgi:hypothetical protein
MTFASSSVEQIGFIQEATFGVTPTSGNYKKLRMTGESLNYTISKESSEEINNSRTVSSMIPVTASADGGIDAEISYAEYDPLIEAVLQSSFTPFGTNGVGATFTADFTATTITASAATTGTSAFTLLKRGQFFRLSAPGNANNGKILRVSLTVAPTSTVITLAPSTPAVVATGVALCAISSSRLTNGADQRSFSIERQNSDIGEYWVYKGMTASSWDLSVSSGARSTMSFNFMGKKAERDTSTNLPGTAVESQAYDIHSGSTGPACYIWVDGAPLVGTFVQSVNLTYDNALRSQEAICELGAIGIGSGTVALTGTLEVYFANGDLFEKFQNNQSISFTVSTLDDAGNGYLITIPKANLSSLSTSAGGKDQDMMLSIEITGLRDLANADPALRQLVFIDRVGAAVTP